MRNTGRGFPAGSEKPAGKVYCLFIKKPQLYDFFFFVEPKADKNADLNLPGERRQAV